MKAILCLLFWLLFSFHSFGIDPYEIALKKRTIADYDSSIYYFNQALLNKNNSDTTKAYIFIEKGKSHQLNHNYGKALSDFSLGFKIFKQINHKDGTALTYIYFAEFNRNIGRLKKAELIINKVKPILKHIRVKTKALYYNRYAAIIAETQSKNDEDIILYSNKAIEICKKNNFKLIEASSYNQLGFLYSNNKQHKKAIDYYTKALDLFKTSNDLRSQVNVLRNLARLYFNLSMYELAIEVCNNGLELIGENLWYMDLDELYRIKINCLEMTHQYKKATKLLDDYITIHNTNIHNLFQESLKDVETKYEVEKKDKQIINEQEKAKISKQESEQKEKEKQLYLLLSIALVLILTISIFAYYKIKKANQLLKTSNHQKEILLQEVHHRVKNNLTVLNSLLYLRSKQSVNKETKLVLSECQTRILSMALVHQNLYDVDDAEFVDLEKFIKELIVESKQIFTLKKSSFKTNIKTNNIKFDMSFTVFLGLILNEFITNSYKYAFIPNTNNTITIHLNKEQNNYILSYTDSGKGLPKDFNLDKTSGFGFKLIKIMINQIQGNLNYSNKNNTFTIKFKKD